MWTSFSSRSMGYRHDDEQTGTVVCDSHDWNSIVMLQIDRRKTLCRLVNVDQRGSRFSEPVSTDQHLPALECTVVLDGSQPRFRLTSTGQNWSAPVFRDLFFHQHPSMAAFSLISGAAHGQNCCVNICFLRCLENYTISGSFSCHFPGI